MRIRDGETGDALDIRVELDSTLATADEGDDPASLESDGEDETAPGLAADTATDAPSTSLTIPDDPTVLSYLLSGIVQVELPRRQRLLEAATTVERLEDLIGLLDREVLLLSRRLRLFSSDSRTVDGARRS
jgi:hypothetical protein